MNSTVARLLSPQESSEIEELRQDTNVIGFALVTPDGDELEVDGLWEDTVPVFENIYDMASRMGSELGEEKPPHAITVTGAGFELIGLDYGSCQAILLRRKGSARKQGASDVG